MQKLLACGSLLVWVSCQTATPPETLLARGRFEDVLYTVRPVSAKAARLRASALRGQGRLAEAKSELLLGLAWDERSADTHRLLGYLLAEMGAAGSALAHLQRSLELDAGQPGVRKGVALLLARRALLRSDAALGLLDPVAAAEDSSQAERLDPSLSGLLAASQPGDRGSSLCPGPPAGLEGAPAPRQRRCAIPDPRRLVEAHRARYLLLGCGGAQLALRLEQAGCVAQALELWGALAREAPRDARWPLMQGRAALAQGRPDAAHLYFEQHQSLSEDRAAALLRIARALLAAGLPREAGDRAVWSMVFARHLEQQLEAVRLLSESGQVTQARQAAGLVLHQGWGMPAESLRSLLERATGSTAVPALRRPPQ